MKNTSIIGLITGLFLFVTSGLIAQFDDIYYNPDDDVWVEASSSTSSSGEYDDAYYEDETYDDTDTWDEYNYYYTSRLRRFHRPFLGFDYYDDCYVDPFFYGDYGYSPRIRVTFGYGYRPYWGRYHYRHSYWYDPWYDPWYNTGYCGGSSWGRYGYGYGGYGYRHGYRDGFYDGYNWGRYGYGGYGYGGYGGYGNTDHGNRTDSNRDTYYGSRRSGVVKTSGRGPVTTSGIRKKSSHTGTTTGKSNGNIRSKANGIRNDSRPVKPGTLRHSNTKRSTYRAEPSPKLNRHKSPTSRRYRSTKSDRYHPEKSSPRLNDSRRRSTRTHSKQNVYQPTKKTRSRRGLFNRSSSYGTHKSHDSSQRKSVPKYRSRSNRSSSTTPRYRSSSHRSSQRSSSWRSSNSHSSPARNFSSGRSSSSSRSSSHASSRGHSSGMRRR